MSNDLEIINPETIKGGAAGCTTRSSNCGTRSICIIKFRDAEIPISL